MRYFAEGRVRDFRFDGELAQARVEGSTRNVYDTRVRLEGGGRVVTSCSCDAYATYGDFLQARGRGALRARPRRGHAW